MKTIIISLAILLILISNTSFPANEPYRTVVSDKWVLNNMQNQNDRNSGSFPYNQHSEILSTGAPGINNSKSDSLPAGVSEDWLQSLRDENGNRIINKMTSRQPEEPESDAFQRKIINGSNPSESFGQSVSSAGDVNGDGYDDIIVGAYGYNSYTGRAYIYYGGLSLDTIPDVIMTGELTNSDFGLWVSSAGDVNGDGYSDIIVGSSRYSSSIGRAYIFFGGASMNNTADVILTGEAINNRFGHSVSTAGDVNGDGYSDVIVGAFRYNSYIGRAYIFYGGVSMNNIADVTMTGETINNYFGFTVSSAGDVNGDGYSDALVGASGYNSNTGRAYVFFGGASMNNSADVTMTGEAVGNSFGALVSFAGDVNGDSYSDIIIGAYGYSSFTGRSYIFYGGSFMNNISDVTMTGEAVNNYFGISVSSAGDLNGDGYFDVIIGANGYSSNIGRSYVYFGGVAMNNISDVTMTGEATGNYFGASVSSAGDINGDQNPDLIVGAWGYNSSTGRAYFFDYVMNGEMISDLTLPGGGSFANAGDVNNDGFDDVIVGDAGYNGNTGRAHIYFGGIIMDTIADVVMTGESIKDYFSYSVSSAGDVNNDGYDDVIIGAYGYDSNGRAYIYLGGTNMDNSADIIISGTNFSNFGWSVSSAGDVNGDGYSDVIIGESFYNTAYLFFGGVNMNNVADITLNEVTSNFGFSVSSAGDVNGDGFSDVIVGTYDFFNGRAYVYFGGILMDNTADYILGEFIYGYGFGINVSSAGDVNGDGNDDVIIGAYGGTFSEGKAFIFYYGGPFADVVLSEGSIGDRFGISVSNAGDINGDGFDDVIIGADGFNLGTGKAFVYFGGYYFFNNIADFTFSGESTENYFGYPVSNTGDINGDGFDDLIVGAATGRAYIFNGSAIIPPIQKSYRTISSGDWNSLSTWEMSIDGGGTWTPSTSIPSNLNNSIDIRSSHIINISTNSTARQISIANGGQLILDSLTTLSTSYLNIGVGGQIFIDTLSILHAEGYLFNYGGVYGRGILELQGIVQFVSYNSSSGFNVTCRFKNATTCYGDSIIFHKKVILDDLYTYVYIYPSNTKLIVNSDLENNGTINGNGSIIVNSSSFTNNGLISIPILNFQDTTLISGFGNITSSNVTFKSGCNINLGSEHQFSSIYIDTGAVFNLYSNILKLSGPGTSIINNGILYSSNGTIEYIGNSTQNIFTTNVNFGNMKINNPAGVILLDSFLIPGQLSVINGDLNLNSNSITLLDTASLIETPGNTVTGSGSITTTRNISQPNSMDLMGMVITSPENFGQTTITRINASENVAPGKPSFKRYYDISPQNNTALNANILFKYDQSELDTLQESTLGLYRSTNGGANYIFEGGSVDTANNLIALNNVQSFSRWTAARLSNIPVNNDSIYIGNLYALGEFPFNFGSLDTFAVRINRIILPENDSVTVNYVIKNRLTFEIIFDTSFTIPPFQNPDTLILLQIPIIQPGSYQVWVQSIPEQLGIVNGFEAVSHCFNVNCDSYNYAQPCDSIRLGQGFSGIKGRMTAAFRNINTSSEPFIIRAIDARFIDTTAVGNAPFKLAVYSDNGNGKPGNALYISPVLNTPSGSNSVETISHEITTPVSIAAGTRFHIGLIQTSNTNIRAASQEELPIRGNTFFFSNTDSGNVWFDFADSSKNFRLDISPRTSTNLTLINFIEGIYNTAINKMTPDTVKMELRSFISPYSIIDSAKEVLDSNGTGLFSFTKAQRGSEYYFVVRHRNSIETWSHNTAEIFDFCDKQYNFSDNISKAYGNNLQFSNGKYLIFSGDINQDGTIDITDASLVDNDAFNFASGYIPSDINGDGVSDITDAVFTDNNSFNFVSKITP